MNVNLEEELFTSNAVDEATILLLIWTALEGRHRVFPMIDPNSLDDWLSRHSSDVVDTCRFCIDESLVAASQGFCDQNVFVRPGPDDWSSLKLSPESARAFLQTPIEVWFENDLNDSNFLLSCVADELSNKLREFEDKRWIQFQNAGGIGSMPLRVKGIAENRRHSSIFIFDSDSRLPEVCSKQSQSVIAACKASHIQYHCLSRRAIENYIPTRTLKTWAFSPSFRGRQSHVRKQRVTAFGSITEEQRCYFNLKLGFDGDLPGNTDGEWSSRKDEIDSLFVGISDRNRNHLKNGIQGDVANQIYGKIKIPYSHLWENGSSDELNEIAQNILRKA
jgi:hypothetical protein